MLQPLCESSVGAVWQQRPVPAKWLFFACCFWTAGKPRSSPVSAGPLLAKRTDWLESQHLSNQQGQPAGEKGVFKMPIMCSHWKDLGFDSLLPRGKTNNCEERKKKKPQHLYFTHLLVGSVDKFGMWSDLVPPAWRNRARRLDWSLHFSLLLSTVKALRRKEWMSAELLFPPPQEQPGTSSEENGAGVRMVLLINSDREQLCSIRLDCVQPAGFETWVKSNFPDKEKCHSRCDCLLLCFKTWNSSPFIFLNLGSWNVG